MPTDDKRIEAHLSRISFLARAGKFQAAENEALRWLDEDSEGGRAWLIVAGMRELRRDYRGSVEAASHFLSSNGEQPHGWWYRGYQYLLFGLPSFAEDDFDKSLERSMAAAQQHHAQVCYMMRAEARRQLGDYHGALEDCARVSGRSVFWLNGRVTVSDLISHCRSVLRLGEEVDDEDDTAG